MRDATLLAGWYLIIRNGDDAVSCLHRDARGRWQLIGRKVSRLPAGWRIGPQIDGQQAREILRQRNAPKSNPRDVDP
jgi:hypothetical protein